MNRVIARLLAGALLAGWLGIVPAAAQEARPSTGEQVQAKEVAVQYTVQEGTGEVWALSDANRTTRYRSAGKTTLTLAPEQPVSQLYIVWETPPKPWTLAAGGNTSTYGKDGFIHEYVALDQPQTQLTLSVEMDEVVICDIYAFGEGEAPDWVQRWQPPYQDADMLLIPTHADDEHLFFGGTMPLYAGERGLKVQVAYLTNHWAEPYRPHELLNGLWAVGITAYPVMSDFVDLYAASLDQAKTLYAEGDVIAYQVELLRRFRPEVVVGHDVNGEYGHGVHMYNTYALQKALDLSTDAQQYPESAQKYGVWEVPKTYLHLYGENATLMDWNVPLDHFGGKTALDMAKEGFAMHKSQQEFFSVEDYGPYDCRKFGLYRTTVGLDVTGGDFTENLAPADFSDYVPPEPEISSTAPEASEPPETSQEQSEQEPQDGVQGQSAQNLQWAYLLAAGGIGCAGVVTALLLWKKRR